MVELVKMSRDGATAILRFGQDFKTYSVLKTGLKPVKNFTTLSSALNDNAWRRPTLSEKENIHRMVEKIDLKTYRVPKAVSENAKTSLALKRVKDPVDIHFLSLLASGDPVSVDTVTWLKSRLSLLTEELDVLGGTTGKAWADKFTESSITASGMIPEEGTDYYAVGDSEDFPNHVKYLIKTDESGNVFVWVDSDWFALPDTVDDYDMPSIVEISDSDAEILADWSDDPTKTEEFFVLTDIDPEERNLVELAYSEIDWEHVDRLETLTADATGYSRLERSENATRQQRSNDGRFGGGQVEKTNKVSAPKARLPELPLVENVKERIEQFLEGTSVLAAVDSKTDPLYFAVVDPIDNTAVVDAVSVVPGEDGEVTAWVRKEGDWESSPDYLNDFTGDTPPPVVELSDESLIKNVIKQIDEHDINTVTASIYELADYSKKQRETLAKNGMALPDGSYPIKNVSDLRNAIKAYGRALDNKKPDVRKHIEKRAKALNKVDLIPSDWKEATLLDLMDQSHLEPLYGEYGEITSLAVKGIGNAERLREYWTVGKGAAKIRWGTPGDLTRCHRQLNKYMPGRSWGYCQNLHQRVFGMSNAKKDKLAGK